jgi:bacteriocin biosynthesis cyclodehydratase domain-containing protein
VLLLHMNDALSAADSMATVRRVKLDARDLELARLGDGSVVVKRGVREVLLRDAAAGGLLEELAELLDGTRTAEALLAAVGADRRGQAVQLLTLLVERGLLGDAGVPEAAEARFWTTFGAYGASAPERLSAARVTVLGGDTVARGLVAQLLACGVGTIDLVLEPALVSRDDTEAWLAELQSGNGHGRVQRVDPVNAPGAVAGCTLLCAASDEGQSPALTDANREALAVEVPFLPVWVAELVGYVGPTTEPFDTACLRCYQLRAESDSRHPESVRALRERRESESIIRDASGLLPPMAAAVSAVAAMEAVKRITGFAPPDAVGRVIELNLVSFASHVRRVLKLPRCPDCSDVMRRSAVALAQGPQVPGRL